MFVVPVVEGDDATRKSHNQLEQSLATSTFDAQQKAQQSEADDRCSTDLDRLMNLWKALDSVDRLALIGHANRMVEANPKK